MKTIRNITITPTLRATLQQGLRFIQAALTENGGAMAVANCPLFKSKGLTPLSPDAMVELITSLDNATALLGPVAPSQPSGCSALYHQIDEAVMADLHFQVSHLSKIRNNTDFDTDERARFAQLYEGAKTVISILKRDPLLACGTDAWLANMDQGQLQYTLESTTRLLQKKVDETKIKLWKVYSGHSSVYHFQHYSEASAKLIEILTEDSVQHPDRANEALINPVMIPESEVADYLGVGYIYQRDN
jgi:hypothetical protein